MLPVVLGFQTIIWALLCWNFLQNRSGSVFHPFGFYLLFHGLVFVMRPILEYAFGFHIAFDYMWFYPSEDRIIFTLFLSTWGLIAFAIFGWAIDGTGPHFDRALPNNFTRVEWQAFVILAILLMPVAIYSFYLGIGQGLGGSDLIQGYRDPITGVYTLVNTTGYISAADNTMIPCCLMLIWATRFRFWSYIPFLVFLALHAYLGWGRWAFILSVAMLALLAMFHNRRRWIQPSWIVIGIAVFALFQQLGQNREYYSDLITGTPHDEDTLERNRPWIERFDGLDFANFDYLTYIVDIVPAKSETYSYFTQYLQLFTEPIPRILWPDKPYGQPIDLVNLNNYGNFVGLTASLVGDGWVSLGWFGVFITMGLVGYINMRLHRWFWTGEATNFKVLAYCTYLPLTMQWFRDGGISIAKFVLFTVMPLVLWRIIIRMIEGTQSNPDFRPRIPGRPGVKPAPSAPLGRPLGRP